MYYQTGILKEKAKAAGRQGLNKASISLWSKATFMPQDRPSKTESLLTEVWRLRQATFLDFGIRVCGKAPSLAKETGLSDHLMLFSAAPPQTRRRITEYPPFRIWLRRSIRSFALSLNEPQSRDDGLKNELARIQKVMGGFHEDQGKSGQLTIAGTRTRVARFSVDPLITDSIPPSYTFPDQRKRRALEQQTVYHLPFFLEVVTTALDRIKSTWPEAYRDFARYVRLIIHVTDGEFRSCSADRYAGVILLSADDDSLLGVEESLLHEFGHQILYNVMELDRLILDSAGRRFELPWSGQERDFYGYFHAFYIYILLASYYERIKGRTRAEQEQATDRIRHILKGLISALPDFDAATEFTNRGRSLFHTLKEEVGRLKERNGNLL